MSAPSLIIGAGGIGSQICAIIEKKLRDARRYNADEPVEDHVKFVAIDTDVNTLKELERKGFQGTCIALTGNMTVKKCLEIIKKENVKWYHENPIFDNKPMTEGAGQQRSISRLAFEYCMRDGKINVLDRIIDNLNLLKDKESHQQMRFFIISSLAGGTGSGIILPLSMYINRTISNLVGDTLSTCKGFFILSSALYATCESPLEQKSLDANAYAAIKELSAFMRLADTGKADDPDTMSELNRLVYSIGKYGNYSRSTYDYCFLFGMHNHNAKGIRNFESLKDLVADAVYMQACSPISDSNSSREDNKLRHNAMVMVSNQERWLRRFGGIGCGRMIYPYEEMKTYLGIRWAKETMQKDWRKYDTAYEEELKKQRKAAMDNPLLAERLPERHTYYVKAIREAQKSDLLAQRIKNDLPRIERKRKDSAVEKVDPWICYAEKIEEKGDSIVNEVLDYIKSSKVYELFDLAKQEIGGGGEYIRIGKIRVHEKRKGKRNRYDIIKMLDEVRWPALMNTIEYAFEGLGDCGLFQLHDWNSKMEEVMSDYMIERYFIKDNNFIHPNAIRYFLYQAWEVFSEKIEFYNNEVQKRKAQDRNHFNIEYEANNKKLMLTTKAGIRAAKNADLKYQEFVEIQRVKVLRKIFIQGKIYIKNLIDCYEKFYLNYDGIIRDFSSDVIRLEEQLNICSGVAKAMVCCDNQCRSSLFNELYQYGNSEQELMSDLSYEIYYLMHEADLDSKTIGSKRCTNMIKDFWIKCVETGNFGKEILDMNILQAMNKEHIIKFGSSLPLSGYQNKIEDVKERLVAPFVRYFPRVDMDEGYEILCYHSELLNSLGVEKEVVQWMQQISGIDDAEYCTKYEIMFYHSFVGLEAYEVLDFLHGIDTDTLDDGRAFQSYVEMQRDMDKYKASFYGEHAQNKAISPHSDSMWDSLIHMPDPSVKYQKNKEKFIARAFVYAYERKLIKKTGDVYELSSFAQFKRKQPYESLHQFHEELYSDSDLCIMLNNHLDTFIREQNRVGRSEKEKLKEFYGEIDKEPMLCKKGKLLYIVKIQGMLDEYAKGVAKQERKRIHSDLLTEGFISVMTELGIMELVCSQMKEDIFNKVWNDYKNPTIKEKNEDEENNCPLKCNLI